MGLNEEQQLAYDTVLNGSERIIKLTGKAGAGKGYVTTQIAKDYQGTVLVTATTNKAKELLALSTELPTYTTHSALGFVMTRNGIAEYLSDVNPAKQADLLIVDECSMLPQAVYNKILREPYKKILFVGDDCQLPAVGLAAKIIPDVEVQLIKQMRQNDDDVELKKYLECFRQSIKAKRNLTHTAQLPTSIIEYTSHSQFCKAYLDCTASKRILAYSNKTVDAYNKNVKNRERFNIGDLLVLDKPLGSGRNGDIIEVVNVKEESDRFYLAVNVHEQIHKVQVFKTKTMETTEMCNILQTEGTDRYWQIMDKTLHPKHIFASTIHKAQGMTIDEVFVDLSDIRSQLFRRPTRFNNYNKPISVEEYLKLLYVAISRMRVKAHLFVGDKRDYKALKRGKK